MKTEKRFEKRAYSYAVKANQDNGIRVITMDYSRKCQSGYREEYEQEINLKDLLFHILYRWRSLLLAAIVICGLAAGYAVQYNGTILPEKQTDVQTRLEEQKQLLQEAQKQEQPTDRIKELQALITDLQEELDGLRNLSFVKYCAAGFAAGVFCMAFLYGFVYVLSDKLRGERELRDRYGYFLLGTFPRQKKKLLSVIDAGLERLEGVSEQITEEETYRIISIHVKNLTETGGTFLVTGTVDFEKLQKFVDVVSRQIENATLTAGANMNATADTLKMLAECDAVILVEERDKSLRAKIHKEYESITALAKPVAGYAVM